MLSLRRGIAAAGVLLYAWFAATHAAAGTVSFDQLSWLDETGITFTSPNSDWGLVNVKFDSSDLGLFSPDGSGGFFGFVNLATSTPSSGATTNWAVQNLPVHFGSAAAIGNFSDGLTFSLGNTPGMAVSGINYILNVMPTPLNMIPTTGISASATVANLNFLIGGIAQFGGGTGQTAPPPAQNFMAAAPGGKLGQSATITGTEADIPAINEQVNGCAPGAAARSLKYLGVPGDAQTLYGKLRDAMKTHVGGGNPDYNGTRMGAPDDYTNGKNVVAGKFGVVTKTVNSFTDAMNALKAKCDVELFVSYGAKDNGDKLGGHLAFVTQIKCLTDAAGAVTGYTVSTLNSSQDGSASNNPIDFQFDAAGKLLNFGHNGSLVDFRVECVPEQSSLVMLSTGVAALVLVGLHRRRGIGRAAP
jgi:hypothetical protein